MTHDLHFYVIYLCYDGMISVLICLYLFMD